MAELTTYLANKLLDHAAGRTAFTMPSVYIAALYIRDQSNNLRSTAVAVGDFTIPATPNGRLYRCTTAGTTGSGEPTWATTDGGTTTDGTATWTEHTPSLKSQTNVPECVYTGYGRQALGTGGSCVFNAAASGSSSNGSAINFGTKTGGTDENVAGWATFDASTNGNMLEFGLLTSSPYEKLIQNNDAPTFAASSMTRNAS